MSKGKETSLESLPFKIHLDKVLDARSLTFRLVFKKRLPDDRVGLESEIRQWADKGREEGYGGKYMEYLDEGEDDSGEGGFVWSKKGKYLEFWVDMGKADIAALEGLFSVIAKHDEVKEMKISSGSE